MLKNYIKVTLRSLSKHKGYSLINIFGLAIGMACCLLITIWVLDELSFDKFHENIDVLHRVEENQHYSGRDFHVTVTPYPLGPVLVAEIPEIMDATRFVYVPGLLLEYKGKAYYENEARAVDPSFLKMFTFPLLKGNVDEVLQDPHSLILSEDIAVKYFGDENPIGKVIEVNNKHEFTVTGILKEVPHNSSLEFDILLPYEFLKQIGQTNEHFGSNSIQTFIQLQEPSAFKAANEKIFGFIRKRVRQSRTDLELIPYKRLHLHSYWGYDKDPGAIQYVYIFSAIAFFVLLIACINFMNLSTARSANRAKEVGLRKVVGAQKSHLLRQFYGESIIVSLIALILAVIIVTLLLPVFGNLAAKEMSWKVGGIGSILAGLLGITVFTGIIAGSYPAVFLSSFRPVKVLRGSFRSGTGGVLFRRILVVVQFSLSVLLIIGTVVVYKQLYYMKNQRLGWDKDHLIYVPLRPELRSSYNVLKQELIQEPGILGVTATSQLPTHIGSNSSNATWEGKDPAFTVLIGFNAVDFDYTKTVGIEMAEGRPFSRDVASDDGRSFIVNEEVAKIMGKKSVVGERFTFMGIRGTIIGVMKNFHYQSLQNKIEPITFIVYRPQINYMLMRVSPTSISDSVQKIERVWNSILPDYPFEYHFIDERFERLYRSEQRIGSLLNYFAVLAVFVACLGLFGLASFTAEQRTKEIGIRKTLGATVSQIVVLLCREFFVLVLLANVIAWPLSYLLMSHWLKGYAYRTQLSVFVFLGAMVTALLMAVFSVSFQALRAASTNPAKALRYE
ncbi:MAG: ABC transporter permease [Candidatus Aminicenantes bacterium]|nr:ABC transporter permease [Candidatus Aminicenantes bacterium]